MVLTELLESPTIKQLLHLLSRKSMTAEELAVQTDMTAEKVRVLLSQLESYEVVCKEEERYYLNVDLLSKAASMQEILSHEDQQDNYHRTLYEYYQEQCETEFQHAAFDNELSFYESVRSGNTDVVILLMTPLGGEGYGILCDDPLQNLKYHLVITIAMITRFCVNGGMPMEEAYSLSDIYIQKTDVCRSIDEVRKIHFESVLDFTKRMRKVHQETAFSMPVVHILDYVRNHMHEKITIQDVADNLSLSVPYVSRLFKSELGVTFSEYISIKKVEAAQNMLRFSNYPLSEISEILHFSSQSYFIKVFRKHTGMTPKEYKSRFYSPDWSVF